MEILMVQGSRSGVHAVLVVAAVLAALLSAPVRSATDAIQPGHSSVWSDPARSGEGWVLEVLAGGKAALYWFTYDEEGGQRWLGGVGQVTGAELVFPELLVSRGGRFGNAFDPEAVVLEPVGNARIVFQDCQQGVFEYSAYGQSGSLPMRRFSRTLGLPCDAPLRAPIAAHAGQSGSWYDPARSGEGFSLHWLNRDHAAVVWYTYDNDGGQQWMVGGGQRVGSRLVVSLFVTSGARFGAAFDPADVVERPWGVMELELDCREGHQSWTSEQAAYPDGSLAVRRLTRPLGLDCPFASPALSDLTDAGWDARFSTAGVAGGDGLAPTVYELLQANDGDLLAAGYFRWQGARRVPPVIRLRDDAWLPAWQGQLGDALMATALAQSADGRYAVATDRELRLGDAESLAAIGRFDGLVRRLEWRGDELWVAGWFELEDGPSNLARWTGEAWLEPPGGAANGPVYVLQADGDGLLVGGDFGSVGGITAQSLARFDGQQWSALDIAGRVHAAQRIEGELYIGGSFAFEGTASGGVARRSGDGWMPVGQGFSLGPVWGVVHDLALHQGQLHAFGCFTQSGEGAMARPLAGIARWDGAGWQPLGPIGSSLASVWFSFGLCGFEGAPWVPWYVSAQRLRSVGDVLYLAGDAPGAGDVASQGLIAWQEGGWRAQGPHGLGLSGEARLLASGPDGRLHVFGPAVAGGARGASGLFRLDQDRWTPLGPALPPDTAECRGLQVDADGRIHLACAHHPRLPSGDDHPALWRARLLRLDPDGWRELAAGHALPPPTAMAMDASGRLYITGGLIHDDQQRGYLARWDGEALDVIEDGFDSLVLSLALAPSAQGEDIVVSGHFGRIGSTPYRRIARYRGSGWEALGEGLAVAAGALLHEGGRILAAASSDAAVDGSRLVLGQWQEGVWTELATPQKGFPDTGETPPTITAMARAGERLFLTGNLLSRSGGRHALVFEAERFSPLAGGIHGIGGAVSLLVAADAVWFGGAIAEAGEGDGWRSSVGIARLVWD
jgi:hypothetical protein